MKIKVLFFGFVMSSMTCLADAAQENAFAAAAKQAGKAADAKQLAEIHERLQCVLNCLEGAKGHDYKQTAANPCSGKGAMETLPEKSANRVRVGKAIVLARVGITLHDFPPAHYLAQAIHAILIEDQSR
jgi:hypothetical protein